MTQALPGIPRLYTALAEWLACVVCILNLPRRFSLRRTAGICAAALAVQGSFLQLTGDVPLFWWLPCMAAATGGMFLLIWSCCRLSRLDAVYCCTRAFLLAEFAASLEWQLHCAFLPGCGAASLPALVLLAAVYGVVYACVWQMDRKSAGRQILPHANWRTLSSAVLLALTAFAVSNLDFVLHDQASNSSIYYIRTLVDFCGLLSLVLIQQQRSRDQLNAELQIMDQVLHRQYEQYQQSKESVRLINRSYHDLKLQVAALRRAQQPDQQARALDALEHQLELYDIRQQTGNPVLDTLLTAKSLYCTQHGIQLTSVADGHLLDFLPAADICTLVGIALDNACESVLTLPDPDKRLVHLAIFEKNRFVMLRFENYCESAVPMAEDRLPATGYGLKSLQAAAERWGGAVTAQLENNWFTVRVLLPGGLRPVRKNTQ